MSGTRTILVSACLLGVNCRYDATSNLCQALVDHLTRVGLTPIPICPEQLAGLPTPRPKAWFTRGEGRSYLAGEAQLIDENGREIGATFLRGAEETLKIAKLGNCRHAILKQRSPSCGSRLVHRNGELVPGAGITCALLEQNGIRVTCEESFTQRK